MTNCLQMKDGLTCGQAVHSGRKYGIVRAGVERGPRSTGLSLRIVLNFNHRGTENTENTDSRVLLGWEEATEAAFGHDIYSIYSPRTWGTSVFSVPLW